MDYGDASLYGDADASPGALPAELAAGSWSAADLAWPILDAATQWGWSEEMLSMAYLLAEQAPELAARAIQLEHDEEAANAAWKVAPPHIRTMAQTLAGATADGLISETAAYYREHPDELAAAQKQAADHAARVWGDRPGVWSTESWQAIRDELDRREAAGRWGWVPKALKWTAAGLAAVAIYKFAK